jgi:endonuclease V-like protein UPF0215 family
VKQGVRALGVAESYQSDSSTLAGVVTRASRVVDGFVFGSCTVGGTDGTRAILDLYRRLDREDIGYLLIAGIAPAWYNVIDLSRLHEKTGIPVLSVSFEESDGLDTAIRTEFSGSSAKRRLDIYHSLPDRKRVAIPDSDIFVRSVGLEEAAGTVVRAFTPEGGRPEPLRVARLAARAVDKHE